MKSQTTLTAVALLASLGLPALALADDVPPGPPRGEAFHAQRVAHHPRVSVDERLSKLRADLKLTPNQEPAFDAFAGVAKQNDATRRADWERRKQERAELAKLSAPERMERLSIAMKQRVASLDTLTAALKDLYAQLSPDQRQTLDRDFARGPDGRGRPEGRRAPR